MDSVHGASYVTGATVTPHNLGLAATRNVELVSQLADVARHPLPVAVIFGLLHVVMPLAALGLGTLCFPDAPLFTIGWCWSMQCPPVWRPSCGWA